MLRAKQLRLEREKQRELVLARIQKLTVDADRTRRNINETHRKTQAHQQITQRTQEVKQVDTEVKGWQTAELVQRQRAFSEQRRLGRLAISQKRLALLESRHKDYLLKKEQEAQIRQTILLQQQSKVRQKQMLMATVREKHSRAKARNRILQSEHKETRAAREQIERCVLRASRYRGPRRRRVTTSPRGDMQQQ